LLTTFITINNTTIPLIRRNCYWYCRSWKFYLRCFVTWLDFAILLAYAAV